MTENEQSVFGLMQVASDQQKSIDKAIAKLEAERVAFAKARVDMQAATADQLKLMSTAVGGVAEVAGHIKKAAEAAIPAITNAAGSAVGAAVRDSMKDVAGIAVGAMEDATAPFISRFKGATSEAESASLQIKKAGLWFAWKWVALAAGGVGGLLLVTWAIFQTLVLWDTHQLGNLRAERDQLQVQIAQDQITADALAKKVHGIRFVGAREGDFIMVPRDFEKMDCVGNVPCIKLK